MPQGENPNISLTVICNKELQQFTISDLVPVTKTVVDSFCFISALIFFKYEWFPV